MLSVILLSFGLALDALSVSIIEGALIRENRVFLALKLAIVFGFFQAKMAGFGVLFGEVLFESIHRYGSFLSFLVFVILGFRMLKEAFEEKKIHNSRGLSWKSLLLLGVATSIDALVAGFTLPLMTVPPVLSVLIIGMITSLLCFPGAYFGAYLRVRFAKVPLEAVGGVFLIVLGVKTLITI